MNNRKQTILLVDDEENLLEVVTSVLEMEKYIVKSALNVDSAIEILRNTTPDLIISDITMPGKSGFDFHAYVRTLPQLQSVPFVFLSAHSDMESIKTGKELGIDDYLTKPVDFELLLSTIKGKLKRKEQLTEAFASQTDLIKDQLLRLISHEMRTPLTAILGTTELLSDSKEQLSPDEMTSFLEMLQASSKRLNSMVDDFLTAMKIESGEFMKEFNVQESRIDTFSIVMNILRTHEAKIHAKNIEITTLIPDKQFTIAAEGRHIENILQRLIDNAIKFSNDGGVVTLSMVNDSASVTFVVKDEGCGIPKDKQELLFQKFQQVDREKNEQQGAGLGLFIASRLAKANNAELWFDSEEGKGSTFYLKVRLIKA
jgi:two-component system sensor histidine kinase/response regulator